MPFCSDNIIYSVARTDGLEIPKRESICYDVSWITNLIIIH